MLQALFGTLISLVMLWYTGDRFVSGAKGLSRRLNISEFVVGLTVVAIGTSAPEILVAIMASIQGEASIAVGNSIGSNIANVGLVLGLSCALRAIPIIHGTLDFELYWLGAVTLIVPLMIAILGFNWITGSICLAIAVLFTVWLLKQSEQPELLDPEEAPAPDTTFSIVFNLTLGLVGLPLSAHFLVKCASFIATSFGISQLAIGLTVVAIGTSLPELVTSLQAVRHGAMGVVLGNVIGSNIYNLTAVLAPIGFLAEPFEMGNVFWQRDVAFMGLLTVWMLWVYRMKHGMLNSRHAACLLISYIAYLVACFYW